MTEPLPYDNSGCVAKVTGAPHRDSVGARRAQTTLANNVVSPDTVSDFTVQTSLTVSVETPPRATSPLTLQQAVEPGNRQQIALLPGKQRARQILEQHNPALRIFIVLCLQTRQYQPYHPCRGRPPRHLLDRRRTRTD